MLAAVILLTGIILSGPTPASGAELKMPDPAACGSPSDDCWEYGFHIPGGIGEEYVLAKDGTGNIYVGGSTVVSKWNGISWSALGNISHSSYSPKISALAVDGSGNVYIGGTFDMVGTTAANNIAKWNGSSWQALGSGTDSNVTAIELGSGSNLFAGGTFEQAGGVTVNYIALWNGTTWSALGSGVDDYVYAIELDSVNGQLYVGCDVGSVGGLDYTDVARYTFSSDSWSSLSSGLTSGGIVYDLLLINGSGSAITLYVGGAFPYADGILVNNIATWDGSAWYAMANGTDGVVYSFDRSSTGNLYVGGDFSNVGAGHATAAENIASWNGSAWSALGSGVGTGAIDEVYAVLMTSLDKVIVGGYFDQAAGLQVNGLARWDPVGSTWSSLDGGLGLNATGHVLKTFGSTIYAAGNTYAGTSTVNGLAKLDGSTWSGFGNFKNYYVHDLAAPSASTLFIGGDFSDIGITPGSILADNLAFWNGAAWQEVGGGTNGPVTALALDGSGNLYVGGEFTQVGSALPASHIARWDGASWHTLGDGLDCGDGMYGCMIYDLDVDESGNVYAGGGFHYSGDLYLGHIAMWDGSQWHSLNGGLSNTVYALELDRDGRLVAGGAFASANGQILTLNGIGMWNGAAWSALGSGMDDEVGALEVDSNGYLYAGGVFDTAGGIPADNIARWDGFAWSALGSGTNSTVLALAVNGNRLMAGGGFNTAGGKPSAHIGAYDIPPATAAPVPAIVSLSPTGGLFGGAGFWLTINGSNFSSRSIARWNGEDLLTSYVNGTQLMAYIPAEKISTPGSANIAVFTSASSGGGLSVSSLSFAYDRSATYVPMIMQ